MAFSDPNISFGVTGLQGETVNNPTALDFSKTGNPTLFVTQQDGNIWRMEIERQADGADADTLSDFVVTSSSIVGSIKTDIQNYDDDGSANNTTERQMTGLITSTDANGNDVLYVNSSDWRIAVGNDANLGTNSSQIHKLTLDAQTGAVISNVAIVRGLPRSEENHSANGFDIAIDPVTGHQMLWVAVGGNTNNGAPGNNFAGTVDYPYSGAILKIDLDVLESYDVRTDGNGDQFILDLPTLDDPTRANTDLTGLNILNPNDAPNFTLDDNGTGANGELNPDWAGGNNGLNAAKIVEKVLVSDGGQLQFVDNPLLVHSPGFRNPFDVLVTEDGEVFTWDNGPNSGWGGQVKPFVDNTPGGSVNYVEDWTQELATNLFNESGSQTFWDQLHYLGDTSDQFGPYGGFTSPIRAAAAILNATFNSDGSYKPGNGNPLLNTNGDVIFADETVAQAYLNSILIIYEEQGNGNWVDVSGTTGLPADLFDVVSGYNWVHPGSSIGDPKDYYDGVSVQDGTLYSPESQLFDDDVDGSLKTINSSTNGLTEYTSTYFNGALEGAIVAASFNGNLYFEKPIDTDGDGRTDAVQSLGTIGGFGSQPLSVASLGDGGLPGAFVDNDNDGLDDFAGVIVAATYGADSVSFFIPGGEAANPSTDLDLDGLSNIADSHVGDPLDGLGVVVGENETLTWQFELSTPTTPPGGIPNGDSIAGDIGINAVWRNGVDPQVTEDGLAALYDPGVWNLGGASTFVSIDIADTGNAVGTANNQADVLGIGFETQDNLSGITIVSEMLNVFSYAPNTDASKTWDGGEKFGLMVGPGDQSTFVEATIAVDTTGGTTKYGLQLIVEENDVPNTVFVEVPGIEAPIRGITDPNLQIALDVDLTIGAETIAARVRYIDDENFTNWVSTTAVSLPTDVRAAILGQYNNAGNTTGAVVGLVASAPTGDDSFAASWDWVEVTGQSAVTNNETVLYRWNAGTSDVAAVDGGMDWIADASVVTGGPTNVYTGNVSNLHSSASQYTFPVDLFTQERWDSANGSEMGLQFGSGLAAGTYAVRLLIGESFYGPGARQFDVSVEGELFLDDIDLAATFGTGNGGMFEWTGQVTDGTVNIDFDHVLQNPIVNGVEIVQLSVAPPADPVISATAAAFSETDGTVTLNISSATAVPSGETVDVDFEIQPLTGNATPELDYTAAGLTYNATTGVYSGTGQIGAGQTSLDITIDLLPDAEIEGQESFELHVTNVSGANATIGTAVATVTIDDLEDSVNGTGVGDFSDDRLAPTTVNLAQGDTVLVSTQDGDPTRDYDYVTIVVPTGHELTSLDLTDFTDYDPSVSNASFIGMQAGTQFTEPAATADPANLLGGAIYGEFDIGTDILANMADGVIENAGGLGTIGFATPLGAGSYTLWWSQGGSPTTSTITATVAPVNNPNNSAPVITPVADLTVDEQQLASVQVVATDADAGDTITLSAALVDSNGAPVTGYTFTDNGDGTGDFDWDTPDLPAMEIFTATVTASDGVNADVTTDFDITVNDTAATSLHYRWNAGNADVASIDGGPDWIADASLLVGGPSKVYKNANITNLDASVPTGSTPVGLFAHERWDPASGTEMGFEYGAGTLASDSYTVRLFMGEAAFDPGIRQFDVTIEDQLFLDDIDLAATFGTKVGGMFEWTGQVTDGTLDIDFGHVLENPQINGIEIIQGGNTATPVANLSVTPSIGSEDAGTQVTITVTTSTAVIGDQTVDLALSGSGIFASDFTTAVPASITILDGATSASITLDVADDADVESLETATFTISNPSAGVTLGATVFGTLDITDNDPPPNLAPTITSSPAFVISENTTTVGTISVTDPEDDAIQFTLTGGVDAELFAVDQSTGALSFITSPNFEAPSDTGGDNVYDVSVSAFDGTNTVTQDISVTVTDDTGAAELSINAGRPNIQHSNYGKNSFVVSNVGLKEISSIQIDVTNALYPDSVFDPFGVAGDTISKELEIDTNGSTGVQTPTSASYIGAGGVEGYSGILLEFDPLVDGGFETGEAVKFSIDMDPNSIAGSGKIVLDSGSSPAWDVGGVSGAELIGSSFTITFVDGSTTTGQLQSDGSQAGSAGLADQASSNAEVQLNVNGLSEGGIGTYNANDPTVIISGAAGATARVVLTKGFIQPVSNNFPEPYKTQLDAQLAELGASSFPANNAVEFQTVDVLLDGTNQNITALFDFDNVALYDFAGEDQLPLGFVASVIDPNNGDLPLGAVTAPIYLEYSTAPVTPVATLAVTPSTGSEDAGTQVTITVSTSTAVAGDQTLDLALNGSGISASDFTGVVPTSITILDGATTASITLNVADDADIESLETATFTISNPSAGVVVGGPSTATLDITDNDSPVGNSAPTITPVSDITVDELTSASTQVVATDADAGDTIVLSAALVDSNGTPVIGYTFTDNGDGTGDFDWSTPDLPATDVFTATVTASDGVNADVTTTFDITVNDVTPPTGDTVLYRWNGGKFDIAAIDGGPDWISDTSFVVGGTAKLYRGNITTLDASVPTGTAPVGLFTRERWDPASGSELAFEFGNGTLASGNYAVRLFMSEGEYAPGVRQFDVSIEDQLFLDDIDLSATFGLDVGGMFEWTGQVTDGTIDIDFDRGLQNPQINAIEIIQLASGPTTPTASLSVTPSTGSEDAGTQVTITVSTSTAVAGDQTLDLALNGSGISASDFTGVVPTSITILDGATTASITLDVADDTDVESLETATFTISNPSAGVVVGGPSTATLDITDNDAPPNQAPSFTSPNVFNITENTATVGTVTATDLENDTILFGIAGGADANLVTINPNTGDLIFITAPDFEAPQDTGADNAYDVTVSATDGANIVTEAIVINVADDTGEPDPNTAPVIAPVADITVDEFQFVNAEVTATDADAGDTIVLSAALVDSNGAPVTGYTFTDNGDGTGDFDWSTPDLPATDVFTATVTASDGVNADVTTTFDITVNDVTPPTGDTVLYRWNGGKFDIAAIDGGPDWISDTSFVVGGTAKLYRGNITTLDASVPTGTAPVGLFTRERWDPASGSELAFEFGNGTLASGNYAVRLFMSEGEYAPGVRQFDVSIEDQLFLDDIDLSATFGLDVGGMFEWTGQVTDGTIDIDFDRGLQNPQINAIEIIQLDLLG